jgi:hypothetical protein
VANQRGGSDTGTGTLETVVVEVGRLLKPLTETANAAAQGNEEAFPALLEEMGLLALLTDEQVTIVEETLDVAGAVGTLQENVLVPASKQDVPSPDQITNGIGAIGEIFRSVDDLQDVNVGRLQDPSALGDRVTDYLITEYLYTYHRNYYAALRLAGVITTDDDGLTRVTFEAVTAAVTNPEDIPADVYDWGTPGFKAYVLIHYLGVLVSDVYPKASVIPANVYDLTEAESTDRNLNRQLDVPLLSTTSNGAVVDLGVGLVPVPPARPSNGPKKHPGLSVVPYGSASLNETYPFGDQWEFRIDASGELDQMGVVAQPTEGGTTEIGVGELRDDHDKHGNLIKQTPPGGVIDAEAALTYTGGGPDSGTTLFGDSDGTGLRLQQVSLRGRLHATEEDARVEVELPSKMRLVVSPEGGFLEKLFPKDITTDFELTPGYSTEKGFYFDGSVTVKLPISVNVELGPVTVVEVYVELSFDTDTGAIEPVVAVSATGKIGPVDTSVKRLGLDGELDFQRESKEGTDLGVATLLQEFKPPEGAGLGLDTGPISGGGYIEYDPENERYAGVFTITIGPVEVNIMGLLTTEMPDGSDGFSLLLSVFSDFPPVQLSFGFTLNGLGGVMGLNRALKPEPLGRMTRAGNIGSLLFPEDPVAHAQQIVSDLRSIYPPTRAQHVFGPMAKFGWGTPPIIELTLGFVLQLPKLTIAIVGKLSIGLPALDVPKPAQLIRLNLGATGVLKPEQQLFAVDGALYDSRLMAWPVTGNMAMRLGWGANPTFVLSLGGFNPRFEPPESFPTVRRLTVSIKIPGGVPSIEWRGYLAVTANTVQVGASFDARFEAGPVSAHAWWGLDALFQFTPFKVVVDFEAGVKASAFGLDLSARLVGKLTAPSPVHITGKVKLDPPKVFPDPDPRVNMTLGSSKDKRQRLPTVDVLPKLGAELEEPSNWSAQLPADGASIVSLREIEPADDTVLAHPRGRLAVRQSLVPVTEPIERFGNNRPKHVEFDFEVAAASGGELPPVDADVAEAFAPEQYKSLSDSEKMDAPTFERWTAGRTVGGDLFHWGCAVETDGSTQVEKGNAASARLEYEHPQYDSEIERAVAEAQRTRADGGADDGGNGSESEDGAGGGAGYPVGVARSLADNGAVANADSRWRGERKFVPEGPAAGEVSVDSNYDLDGSVAVEPGSHETVAGSPTDVEGPVFSGDQGSEQP